MQLQWHSGTSYSFFRSFSDYCSAVFSCSQFALPNLARVFLVRTFPIHFPYFPPFFPCRWLSALFPGSPSAMPLQMSQLPVPSVRVVSLERVLGTRNGTCWMNQSQRNSGVTHTAEQCSKRCSRRSKHFETLRNASKSFETAGKRSISKGSVWKFWVLSWFHHARSNCAAWPLAKLSSFCPRDLGLHVPS